MNSKIAIINVNVLNMPSKVLMLDYD